MLFAVQPVGHREDAWLSFCQTCSAPQESSPKNGSRECEVAAVAAMAKACTVTAHSPLLFQHPSHSLQQQDSTDPALKQQLLMFLLALMSCSVCLYKTGKFCMCCCLMVTALNIAFIQRLYFPLCLSYGMHLYFCVIAKFLNFLVLERHNIRKMHHS